VFALQDRPRGRSGSRRVSLQAIINHAAPRFGGMKAIYAELSEFGHFGSLGMWASMSTTEDEGRVEWTSYPRWKDENTALIACAQAIELAEAASQLLREFADAHLLRRR
jgi:hypothetical protein